MSTERTIKSFTVADIEKYHKGLLSAKERHDLEKAALDDPFLADALQGYAVAGVNIDDDLDELKRKLAERTSGARAVSIGGTPRPFPWLRAAAMIVLVAGAGLLVYQFSFTTKNKVIVQAPDIKKEVTVNKQEEKATAAPVSTDTNPLTFRKTDMQANSDTATSQAIAAGRKKPAKGDLATSDSMVLFDNSIAKPAATVPEGKEEKGITDVAKETELDQRSQDIAAGQVTKKAPVTDDRKASEKSDLLIGMNKDRAVTLKESASQGSGYNKSSRPASTNFFRGRIVDSNNNPLPYANITNIADNVGTYSDVKGNFVLISPDSVLNVQVRSLGFTDNYVQLQNQAAGNQVVMQDDRSLSEVVISNKKSNSSRSRNSGMVLEEPEPLDGWANYDTYLANNLRVPEIVKSKQTTGGQVQLSFEVNKSGEPVNITVDRSLCESCDKEAIRLLKEGPRWKRKKKNRTSVTISF